MADAIPAGMKGKILPQLVAKGAGEAIDFYKRAFGATEQFRLEDPSEPGKISHAELEIYGAAVMLADEYPDFGALAPQSVGGCPIKLFLYVPDADAAVALAVEAGATVVRDVKDEFYGDRVGMIADPYGYVWSFAARVEDVAPEEMQRRWASMMSG